MLCLASWCGLKRAEPNSLRLVSKLSGKFLGFLHVDFKLPTFERIKDLQVQASKLMRHTTRLPRDILFWYEQEELLPQGFAYKQRLKAYEDDLINVLLKRAKQEGLSMMYDEDDSQAEKVLRNDSFRISIVTKTHAVVHVSSDYRCKVPMELLHLEHQGVTHWVFYTQYGSSGFEVIEFLRFAQRCKEVIIYRGYNTRGRIYSHSQLLEHI
jgi:hypothetical protein